MWARAASNAHFKCRVKAARPHFAIHFGYVSPVTD